MLDLALARYTEADTRRLDQRLVEYQDELLMFLSHPEDHAANYQREREKWPAVLMRLIIYANRGGQGALPQAGLMTVFRT